MVFRTGICFGNAVITSVINVRAFGVKDYIAQMMFNSPPGLTDAMDLAKMLAVLKMIHPLESPDFRIWRQTIEEVLDGYTISKNQIRIVHNLKSGYLKNDNGYFEFIPFENTLQVSPILAFLKFDFNSDGTEEVLAGGNYFGVKPFMGRMDSFSGALIKDENNVILGHDLGLQMTHKSVRHLNIITLGEQAYLLIT